VMSPRWLSKRARDYFHSWHIRKPVTGMVYTRNGSESSNIVKDMGISGEKKRSK